MRPATHYGTERREKRPCPECGYVRLVKVTPVMSGDEQIREMLGSEHCRACDLDLRARVHENAARKMREQAALIRRNRSGK